MSAVQAVGKPLLRQKVKSDVDVATGAVVREEVCDMLVREEVDDVLPAGATGQSTFVFRHVTKLTPTVFNTIASALRHIRADSRPTPLSRGAKSSRQTRASAETVPETAAPKLAQPFGNVEMHVGRAGTATDVDDVDATEVLGAVPELVMKLGRLQAQLS